jgi:hypothetical protein
MSVQVNGDDIMAVIHVVRIVGSIVTMLIVGLLLWWAVRPSRRARDRDRRQEIETDEADNEDMWRIVDRMEERLAVLERALADQVDAPLVRAPRQDRMYAPADDDRNIGRTE